MSLAFFNDILHSKLFFSLTPALPLPLGPNFM